VQDGTTPGQTVAEVDAAKEAKDVQDAKEAKDAALKVKNTAANKRSRTRRFRRSTRGKWALLGSVVALFMVASGYFVLCFVLGDAHLTTSAALVPESVYAFRRLNAVRTLLCGLTRMMLAPIIWHLEYRPLYPEVMTMQVQDEIALLRRIQQGLLYGDTEFKLPGSLRRNVKRDDLDFGNACKYITAEGMNRMDELDMGDLTCEGFAKGLFTRGLTAGLNHFIDRVEDIANFIKNGPDSLVQNSTALQGFLQSPMWLEVDLMDRTVLRYALTIESQMYIDDLINLNQSYVNMTAGIMAGFLIALCLVYVVVYQPMVRSLDVQLKRARSMLVMVPIDVIQNNVAMRKAILNP